MCGSLLHAGYIYWSSAVRWTLKPDAQLTSGVGLVVGSVFSVIYDWELRAVSMAHFHVTLTPPGYHPWIASLKAVGISATLNLFQISQYIPHSHQILSWYHQSFSHAFLSHPFRLWWLLMNVKAMGFVNLYMGSPRAAVLLCYIGGAPQRSWSDISLVYLNHTLTDQEVQWRNG